MCTTLKISYGCDAFFAILTLSLLQLKTINWYDKFESKGVQSSTGFCAYNTSIIAFSYGPNFNNISVIKLAEQQWHSNQIQPNRFAVQSDICNTHFSRTRIALTALNRIVLLMDILYTICFTPNPTFCLDLLCHLVLFRMGYNRKIFQYFNVIQFYVQTCYCHSND